MATVANDVPTLGRNVPDATDSDDLTVRDVLSGPCLSGTVVLAGHSGLDRVVRRLNVMEVPDILPWVKPNELILTTGYALTRADASAHEQLLLDLVTELNARGLSAMALKLGRYLDAVPRPVLDRADELGFPILQLPQAVAFDEILSEVFSELLDRQARVLAQADALHRTITAIVLGGGGLPQIAQEVSRVLESYIVIASPDGRIVAEHGDALDRAALQSAELIDASGRMRVGRLRSGLQRLGGTNERTRRWLVAMAPILAAGVDHGRIVAYRAREGAPSGLMQALERTAIVAALSVTKELAVAAVEGKFRADYLRDILTGLTPVDDAAVEHCRALGWDIDRPLVVAVAELDLGESDADAWANESRTENDRLAAAWQHVLRGRDKTIPVVGFSHEVVALLPAAQSAPSALVAEVVKAVGNLRDAPPTFSTGVSRVQHPADLADAYAQARRAVRVGRRMHGAASISHFDTLGVHRLLSLVPDDMELKSFASEVLGELARTTPGAADLRMTLQTLLDTNLNVAETARLLHFHYNTLRYRIAKLERIIGPFTTDPHLRLDVALALQVMEMHGI